MLVKGAYRAQRALEAGVLDELVIDQIPVLFGGGRRMDRQVFGRTETRNQDSVSNRYENGKN